MMNVNLLEHVRDTISTSDTFNMNSWATCIAGVTCQLFNSDFSEGCQILDFAQEKLKLTRSQAVELFCAAFQTESEEADRQTAIRRIDRFIEKYNQVKLIPYTEEMSQDDDKLVEGVL